VSKRLEEIAQELRPAAAQVLAIDLSLPGAPEEIHRKLPTADVLVNNAGFTVFGKFADNSLAEELNMMQLNMSSLVILTKLYLAAMMAAGSGKIRMSLPRPRSSLVR
jgi:short-subunit dehydrogenase